MRERRCKSRLGLWLNWECHGIKGLVNKCHAHACRAAAACSVNTSGRPSLVPGFSTKDLQFIIRFHEEFSGRQFAHLVHSLCPAVPAHELVKVSPLCTFLAYPAGLRSQMSHGAQSTSVCMSPCNTSACMQAGLVLAVLGGVQKPDGASSFSGALHVLLCGSAGMYQSELLQV